MTSLLFPPSTPFGALNNSQKRMFYPAILTDIVRGSSDAIDALELFRDLLSEKTPSPDSVGYMAFDAHVGDTSCQLRSGMLKELLSAHRNMLLASQSEGQTPDWLLETLCQLEKVRDGAKDASSKLTKERIHPSKLGFGVKQDSPEGILRVLEWSEPLFVHSPKSLYDGFDAPLLENKEMDPLPKPGTANQIVQTTSNNSAPAGVSGTSKAMQDASILATKGIIYHMFLPAFEFARRVCNLIRRSRLFAAPSWRLGRQSIEVHDTKSTGKGHFPDSTQPAQRPDELEPLPKNSASGSLLRRLASTGDVPSTNRENSVLTTRWRLLDTKVVVRFLVYSYVLSKYKSFCRLQKIIGARLDPEAGADYGDDLTRDCIDPTNRDYKHTNSARRVGLDFQALQVWLSDLSCAWLQSLAARSLSKPNLGRLLGRTTQKSVKTITSMPAYLGYLLLREMWGRDQDTLILVDRRFCEHGFHSNFFLVHLEFRDVSAAADKPDEVSSNAGKNGNKPGAPCASWPQQSFTLGHHVSWHLEHVTADWLIKAADQDTPHIVAMGNSIDGSFSDYMVACGTDSPTSSLHSDPDCPDNVQHISDFMSANHDRLTLAFFANHKHYAFPLAAEEEEMLGEERVVRDHMREESSYLAEHLAKSKMEAESLGTADSLKVFAWQHVLLETKGRIAKKVLAQTDVMPLSANVSVT